MSARSVLVILLWRFDILVACTVCGTCCALRFLEVSIEIRRVDFLIHTHVAMCFRYRFRLSAMSEAGGASIDVFVVGCIVWRFLG